MKKLIVLYNLFVFLFKSSFCQKLERSIEYKEFKIDSCIECSVEWSEIKGFGKIGDSLNLAIAKKAKESIQYCKESMNECLKNQNDSNFVPYYTLLSVSNTYYVSLVTNDILQYSKSLFSIVDNPLLKNYNNEQSYFSLITEKRLNSEDIFYNLDSLEYNIKYKFFKEIMSYGNYSRIDLFNDKEKENYFETEEDKKDFEIVNQMLGIGYTIDSQLIVVDSSKFLNTIVKDYMSDGGANLLHGIYDNFHYFEGDVYSNFGNDDTSFYFIVNYFYAGGMGRPLQEETLISFPKEEILPYLKFNPWE